MKNSIVKIEHLSHRYSRTWAIRDINMEIGHTGILGLLGSNGAGKSTTMNILCGALNQTEGKVYIDGIDMRQHPGQAKKELGFLPQNPPLYLDFTVDEYLTYCTELRLMDKKQVPAALEEAKENCGITHFSKRLIRNLSGGYRQRVGIAQAIIHRPKLVVLDEPTNGLDPNQIIEVRSLIRDIARQRSVIFSSHILSEVQLLCNDIIMIEGGKIVFSDTMDAFNNYIAPSSVLLVMERPFSPEDFQDIPGLVRVDTLTEKQVRIHFDGTTDFTEHLIVTGVERGWRLSAVTPDRTAVDEIFKQLSSH